MLPLKSPGEIGEKKEKRGKEGKKGKRRGKEKKKREGVTSDPTAEITAGQNPRKAAMLLPKTAQSNFWGAELTPSCSGTLHQRMKEQNPLLHPSSGVFGQMSHGGAVEAPLHGNVTPKLCSFRVRVSCLKVWSNPVFSCQQCGILDSGNTDPFGEVKEEKAACFTSVQKKKKEKKNREKKKCEGIKTCR